MPSSPDPPLDQTLEALAKNVEKAVSSLVKFQSFLLNRSNADQSHIYEVFMTLRRELKKQWEDLCAYLYRCYAFAADAFKLNKLLGDAKVKEKKEILTDMVESAKELRRLSEELMERKARGSFLSASASDASTSDDDRPKWPRLDIANLQAFVDTHFAPESSESANKALQGVDDALAEIDANIDNMLEFWEFTAEACQLYLETPSPMTDEEATTVTKRWTRYRQALERAILLVTRMNDVILVDPVAIDQGRHKWFRSRREFIWPSRK